MEYTEATKKQVNALVAEKILGLQKKKYKKEQWYFDQQGPLCPVKGWDVVTDANAATYIIDNIPGAVQIFKHSVEMFAGNNYHCKIMLELDNGDNVHIESYGTTVNEALFLALLKSQGIEVQVEK